ncbi:MAG: chromosome segregation protein SMC [Nitrososphaeraceae archaeon]|nr:chromosome segregation protein SMC [Nitrososphaeraceae archaeon]
MVHIKKLEIYGFKSFGFKNTVIIFEKGLIAVTGPNGSGKSNVLDAIMFAIGENSPKALRIDKFQSLFHDSQNRSHRLIRVSLTFDNEDRGIPVDSNSVTVTREIEGQTGDSQFYLNGKKVSKSNIVELLEVVVAAPNKLNIVQQGMITRISELNSEERRRIIEDIIGLSYFDEKKEEALKQLEESDRRLEVAVARMGEVRKRIDELEIERNDQIRYEHIESELKRFKAVLLSNSIRMIRTKLEVQKKTLDSNITSSLNLSKQLEEMHIQIENLESEKTSFIHKVDVQNKAKAQIGSKVTNIVYESERMKAMLKETQQRLFEIERQIPLIDIDKENVNQKLNNLHLKVEQMKNLMNDRNGGISILRSQLEEVNSQIDRFTFDNAKYVDIKEKFAYSYKRLSEIKNHLDISILRLEEKVKVNRDKINANKAQIHSFRVEFEKNKLTFADLKKSLQSEKAAFQSMESHIKNLKVTNNKLEREIASSSNLNKRADNLASRFEAKADVAKNYGNEDVAVAKLMKHPEKFDIKGLAHNILQWDENYERPVLAAGSEWMKAIVVDKVTSMLSIAEYAKLNKLPRLKIIPLDIISSTKRSELPKEDVNIIGNLADFVFSDYKNLSNFLFGNTFLMKTSTSAYLLAIQGYRAVSVDGILFEPAGSSISLDFGSKISDLTKAIILSESIDNLRCSLTSLDFLIKKRSSDLKEITLKTNDFEFQKTKLEAKIDRLMLQISIVDGSVCKVKESLQSIMLNNILLQSEIDSVILNLHEHRKRTSILVHAINKITENLQNIDNLSAAAANNIAQLNVKKNQILKSLEAADIEFRQIMTSSAALNNEIEITLEHLGRIDEQKGRLETELVERIKTANELRIKLESTEAELKILRDEEQRAIDSSGSSYKVLEEYERQIKQLRDNERKISKEFNAIERETAMRRKDISDITSQELHLNNDLLSLGYKDLADSFDVDMVIKELTHELETIKTKINLRAHESYTQVIEGYRSMSNRQNELETERNSIIVFIEEVTKEKKNFFIDAFKRVDNDIRKTFSEVTGGKAWLEMENIEDVFTGGIMLMVQFPGKTERESTGLSGGEKTMAATIFLLALQSLKPSPFYLMDEVDAHLDAQNNERLSKVLLSRSNENQIIMVSLKDTTVAKARIVYGVYSKEGASQIVRYRRHDHEALAEANIN